MPHVKTGKPSRPWGSLDNRSREGRGSRHGRTAKGHERTHKGKARTRTEGSGTQAADFGKVIRPSRATVYRQLITLEDGEARKPFTWPGLWSLQDPLRTGEAQLESGRLLALPASMGIWRHGGRAEFSRAEWASRPALVYGRPVSGSQSARDRSPAHHENRAHSCLTRDHREDRHL